MDPLYISSEEKIKYEAIETTNVKVEVKAEPDIDFEYNEINFDDIKQKPLIKTEKLDLEDDVIIYISDNDGTERLLCEQCGFVSSSASLFIQHKTHHVEPTEKKFKCALGCPFETFYKADLNKHISEKHLVDLESVKKCTSLPERILKDKRGMMAYKKSLLKAENTTKSSKMKQDGQFWYCGGICPFKTQSEDALIKHVQQQHKWAISYKNMIGKSKQEQIQKLKGRKKTVINLNVKRIIYRCSECNDYKNSSRKKVVAHMLRSHPVRPQKRAQKVTHMKRRSHPAAKKVIQKTTVTWYKCGTCSFTCGFTANKTEEFVRSHFRSFHFCDKK